MFYSSRRAYPRRPRADQTLKASARALAAVPPSATDSGQSLPFWTSPLLGLALPATKGPSSPFSAAVAAPDRPTQVSSLPLTFTDLCRRTAHRLGTGPPPFVSPPGGDSSSTGLDGHLPRSRRPRHSRFPADCVISMLLSAVTGRLNATESTP